MKELQTQRWVEMDVYKAFGIYKDHDVYVPFNMLEKNELYNNIEPIDKAFNPFKRKRGHLPDHETKPLEVDRTRLYRNPWHPERSFYRSSAFLMHGDRPAVVVEHQDGTRQAYYRRTGTGSRGQPDPGATAGNYVPFDGIDPRSGWVDKGSYVNQYSEINRFGRNGVDGNDEGWDQNIANAEKAGHLVPSHLERYGTEEHRGVGRILDGLQIHQPEMDITPTTNPGQYNPYFGENPQDLFHAVAVNNFLSSDRSKDYNQYYTDDNGQPSHPNYTNF